MQASRFEKKQLVFKKPITYRMGWMRCVSHLIRPAACAGIPVMGLEEEATK